MSDTNGTVSPIPTGDQPVVVANQQDLERDLKGKVVAAYNALVRVRVSTVIAEVELTAVDEDNRLRVDLDKLDKENAIVTEHDLVEGDIVTVISTALESNTDIREFHAAQVEGALKVLPENLKMLVDLFKDVHKIITS